MASKRATAGRRLSQYVKETVSQDAHVSSASDSQTMALRRPASHISSLKVRPVLTWLVMWAEVSVNIGRRGADEKDRMGAAPWWTVQETDRKVWTTVMWKPPSVARCVADRWQKGCWLGLALRSENSLVSDESGDVQECRTYRWFSMEGSVQELLRYSDDGAVEVHKWVSDS